jgi:hypothetical protein
VAAIMPLVVLVPCCGFVFVVPFGFVAEPLGLLCFVVVGLVLGLVEVAVLLVCFGTLVGGMFPFFCAAASLSKEVVLSLRLIVAAAVAAAETLVLLFLGWVGIILLCGCRLSWLLAFFEGIVVVFGTTIFLIIVFVGVFVDLTPAFFCFDIVGDNLEEEDVMTAFCCLGVPRFKAVAIGRFFGLLLLVLP